MPPFFKSPLFSKFKKGKVKPDGDEKPTPPPQRKPGACRCKITKEGRNLVICIDGTSNQFGEKNTNVIELYSMLEKGKKRKQLTWYHSGIGTYARPSFKSPAFYLQVLSHLIDLAIAWNFERTIMAAYEWLAENYEEGDRIYLFGFSRGAFQVRVLAAMIDKVGLIHKGNAMQIPFAYELYCDQASDKPSRSKTSTGSSAPSPKKSLSERFNKLLRRHKKPEVEADLSNKISMAQHFKNTFSQPEACVHFVGAWDTVSSIGLARGKKMLPRTVDGMEHVCYFRHALALDERRVKFLPEYAHGGSATTSPAPRTGSGGASDHVPVAPETFTPPGSDGRPQTLEVWFAGTHSDIGGGNTANPDMNRSRPPLRWMIYEARRAGLRTRLFDRALLPTEKVDFKESLTFVWKLFEILPWRRLTFTRQEAGKEVTYKPHLGSSRKIHHGQRIHISVIDSLAKEYDPKARPPKDFPELWTTLKSGGESTSQWQEDDADAALIGKFVREKDESAWETMCETTKSGDGLQTVYQETIKFITAGIDHYMAKDEDVTRLLAKASTILKSSSLRYLPQVHRAAVNVSGRSNLTCRAAAQEFIDQFTEFQCLRLEGHTSAVFSVAYSPDGTQIASASRDKTIRLWDALTGTQVGQPLHGHTGEVNYVAFSPDGARIVSGSDDSTLRIWNAETGKLIGGTLEGHTTLVCSVAFSRDGKRIVSGSGDRTLRIWDAETGKPVGRPLEGHTGLIFSVAFSPDGRSIVSGSWDRTIRIWDAETQQQTGEPLEGHQDWVLSVAFSPDGTKIISGSDDTKIRLWDFASRNQVGHTLEGHVDGVRSIAFSPDGKRIVSGSYDRTIRIWDAFTGKQIGEPLWGDSGFISVAFAPDGKEVVSGSRDRTVCVWDVSLKLWDLSD